MPKIIINKLNITCFIKATPAVVREMFPQDVNLTDVFHILQAVFSFRIVQNKSKSFMHRATTRARYGTGND